MFSKMNESGLKKKQKITFGGSKWENETLIQSEVDFRCAEVEAK